MNRNCITVDTALALADAMKGYLHPEEALAAMTDATPEDAVVAMAERFIEQGNEVRRLMARARWEMAGWRPDETAEARA